MNKVFKVIWSEARNAYVVVSEMAKSHGTKSCSTKKLLAMLIATGVMTCASMAPAMAAQNVDASATVNVGKKAVVAVEEQAKVNVEIDKEPATDENSDNNDMMDDSSFIWKMYALAALRASNFYSNYKDLISAEYASLPSQEEVVHANIAFLTDKSGLY